MQGGASPASTDPLPAPATHTAPQSGSRQRRLAADHRPGPDGKPDHHRCKPCSAHETTNMQSLSNLLGDRAEEYLMTDCGGHFSLMIHCLRI